MQRQRETKTEDDDGKGATEQQQALKKQRLLEHHLEGSAALVGNCRDDIEKAICLIKKQKSASWSEIFEEFPHLKRNAKFWWKVIETKDELPLFVLPPDLLEDGDSGTTNAIIDDRELAAELLEIDCAPYFDLPTESPLKRNEMVVANILRSSPAALDGFSSEVQLAFPDLVADALQRLPLHLKPMQLEFSPEDEACLAPELWLNREVLLGWAKAGGSWHSEIDESFRDDQEIMSLLLRNETSALKYPDLLPLSLSLLADKKFMMETLVSCPSLLFQVGANLVGDPDLVIAALSGPFGLPFAYKENGWVPRWCDNVNVFLTEIAQIIRERLQAHDAYVKLVLCSAVFPSNSETSLFRPLFNQGDATSLALSKLIAHFAIPTGKELGLLRRARQNLSLFGINWSELSYSRSN